MPPFGTVRNESGHLIPSPEGAWLLSNGRFVPGIKDEAPPEGGAVWRGYYEAAHYILTLYAQGKLGREKIAYRLNEEGWAYRDRKGQPRMVERDDIQRVTSNFPEYGGIVIGVKARARPAYAQADTEDYVFIPERAVFPIELLKSVAAIRKERGLKPSNDKVKREAFSYALSGLVFCAHCEKNSRAQLKPKLRTALSGSQNTTGIRRYRHRLGIKCGCTNRSITCELLENEFGRLIDLLTIRDEAKDLLLELAIQVDKRLSSNSQERDLDQEKQESIALCRRRIDAAVNLYKDGTIDRKEYLHIRETNEREIAHWEARTTQTEEIALELAMCIEAVQRLSRLWKIASPEDRQGLARSLFESVVFDLDQQQIVEFKLKAWADRFLVLRHALHGLEAIEAKKQNSSPAQEVRNHVPHREFESLSWP